MTQEKAISNFRSVAMKIQISLVLLSLICIGFSIYTYFHVTSYVDAKINSKLEFDIILQLIVACVFNIGLGIMVYSSISKPLRNLCYIIDDVASGNLNVSIPYIDQVDEVGAFARKVKLFKERSERLIDVERVYEEVRSKEAQEKKRKLNDMISNHFDEKVIAITSDYKNISSKLLMNSNNLVNSANKSGGYISNLITIADYATHNLTAQTIRWEA